MSYLTYMNLERFGVFKNETIGPYAPGLNVVFGPNEAGKSTLSAFTTWVLFGQPKAYRARNDYQPLSGEKSGMLIFQSQSSDSGDNLAIERHGECAPQGDTSLVADIDPDTFYSLFLLTNDGLLRMSKTNEMTTQLLRAGSGTASSPTLILRDIQKRISTYTSQDPDVKTSLVSLMEQRRQAREAYEEAEVEAGRFRSMEREYRDLDAQLADLKHRDGEINDIISSLDICKDALEKLNNQQSQFKEQREASLSEQHAAESERRAKIKELGPRLTSMNAVEERALKDRIETFRERQTRRASLADQARSDYASSKAAFEALVESQHEPKRRQTQQQQRRLQIFLSILLPLVLIFFGIPLFIHGFGMSSLTFMTLGLGLVICAILLAAAALFVVFHRTRSDDKLDERLEDAEWVMRQDEKKLNGCLQDEQDLAEEIQQFLQQEGFEEAQGSLRRATAILDDAKETRAEIAVVSQKIQSAQAHIADIDRQLSALKHDYAALCKKTHLPESSTEKDIAAEMEKRIRQRDNLQQSIAEAQHRFGDLKAELAHALKSTKFDRRKTEFQMITTRFNEACEDFARLLLAQRMLQKALLSWENRSQPKVYQEASRLLSLMTAHRWTTVTVGSNGSVEVYDGTGTMQDPKRLSLGTRQQLYLSLRIALLINAKGVGRALPILADDILVNFDSQRREGAARALQELSKQRQVILFTCHEEIVETLMSVESETNIVEL